MTCDDLSSVIGEHFTNHIYIYIFYSSGISKHGMSIEVVGVPFFETLPHKTMPSRLREKTRTNQH
jgi:hypothetical protein